VKLGKALILAQEALFGSKKAFGEQVRDIWAWFHVQEAEEHSQVR